MHQYHRPGCFLPLGEYLECDCCEDHSNTFIKLKDFVQVKDFMLNISRDLQILDSVHTLLSKGRYISDEEREEKRTNVNKACSFLLEQSREILSYLNHVSERLSRDPDYAPDDDKFRYIPNGYRNTFINAIRKNDILTDSIGTSSYYKSEDAVQTINNLSFKDNPRE